MFGKVTHRIIRETISYIEAPFYLYEIADDDGIPEESLFKYFHNLVERAIRDSRRYYPKYRPKIEVSDLDKKIKIYSVKNRNKIFSKNKVINISLKLIPRSLEYQIYVKAKEKLREQLKGIILRIKDLDVHRKLELIALQLGKSTEELIEEAVTWFNIQNDLWIHKIIKDIFNPEYA